MQADDLLIGNVSLLDLAPDLFFGLPETLQPPEQFVFLALGEGQIIVREIGIFLLQLALHFIPAAFER